MKTYQFTRARSINDKEDYTLIEKELDDMHLQLLAAELIRRFEDLPIKAQKIFINNIRK